MSKEDQKQLDHIEEMVKRICECLYGDGNPGGGLTDRMSMMEVKMGLMGSQMKWGLRIGIGVTLLLLGLLGIKEIPKLWL